MWLFGGIITLSKFCVKRSREESNGAQCFLADIDEVCFTGVGIAKILPGLTR